MLSMLSMRRSLVFLLLALCLCSADRAADARWQGWAPGADYDPAVPSPESWLGRPFAEQSMSVDEIRAYLEVLAESSDRVELEYIGSSVQGDALIIAVITDPSHRAALAGRTARLAELRDPWATSRDRRTALARDELALCWIAGSVHGDEASGADAGVMLAYHLCADRSAATRKILESSVVIIDPCQNPDGRRRFLQQIRNFGRQRLEPDASPWAAEHGSTWPGGRTNHFLFDLNRDWAFLTQTETRARVDAFLQWRPQVFVDLHEMARQSSYFFPPPTDPINPRIPPEQIAWFEVFGRANATAFDARGFDYFIGESFDLFYPGFGDSWPTLQGAIGMTYEQASTRGRLMRRPDGTVAGYPEAVEHHFVAALTTVQTTAAHGPELMQSQVQLGDTIRKSASDDPTKEILLPIDDRPGEVRRLAEILTAQGIRILRTTASTTVKVTPLGEPDARAVEHRFPAGSLRIPLEQPAYALIRSLLDPHTPMEESFLAEEESRAARGLHSRFYDVTAWSLVLSYGVSAWCADHRLDVQSVVFDPEGPREPIEIPDADVAWVIPNQDNGVYSALAALWAEDVQVHCALEGVGVGDERIGRGSLVIKRSANRGRSDLPAILARIAMRTGVQVLALNSSYSQAGPSLGSDQVVLARPARIGLLSGPGVSPLSAGALTWLFEERYELNFTVLLQDALDEVALDEFDVLVVPELLLGTTLPLERLDGWVREGGVLVTIGAASLALIEGEPDADETHAEEPWTSVERIGDLAQLSDADGLLGGIEVGLPTDEADPTGLLPPARRPLSVPGAIFRVELDSTNFLSMGKGAQVAAPLVSDRIFTPSVSGHTVGRIASDAPRIAGYCWPVMEEALKGQAWLVEETRGRGRVILFTEDPSFRGTWEGLHALLLNAVLLGPSIGE